MADIEGRREARRRKILENSEKRLKKITGVEEKNTKCELDGIRLHDSYGNETGSSRLLNNYPTELPVARQHDLHSVDNEVSSDSVELETIFQNPRSVENESVSNCFVNVTDHKSYRNIFIITMPIFLSSILVLFDLFQIDIKSLHLNKIFVPLIIYEIVEYFFGPRRSESLNFLTSILLITNIGRNQLAVTFVQHFQSLLNIVQDAMIYFFTFSVSYWLLQIIII